MKKIPIVLPLKSVTLDEFLKEASKSKKFRVEYERELTRLELASQIRKARIEKKLTQKALADKVGVPQSVVARIESGTHGISVETFARIAHAFGKRIQIV